MYLIVYEEGKLTEYNLDANKSWTIGRKDSMISLSSPIAGRRHGILNDEGNHWKFQDNGSGNGTYFNGKKMPSLGTVDIEYNSILRIDNKAMNNEHGVYMLFVQEDTLNEWKYFDLASLSEIYIGRNSTMCQIVQARSYISRKHACIYHENGKYFVEDCQSAAGTWLNSTLVEDKTEMTDGDIIHICDCDFYFIGHCIFYNAVSSQKKSVHREKIKQHTNLLKEKSYLIQAHIQSKMVPNNSGADMKQLLDDVNINIEKGTLVAILGSAGAGKSTVMNCLNGTDQTGVTGTVLFNNEDLFQNYNRLRFSIGSVPQQNTFHQDLTVTTELRQAALKRSTKGINRKELYNKVDYIIQKLGLDAVKNQQIRKLSGGEKRRVHIGIELVAERLLYCLDEPDAGLDPENKKKLFTILKDLVKSQDKTIIVIIHDVAEIDMFDQIIFMTKLNNVGRLAFSGTPQKAREYFGVEQLKDAYKKLTEHPERYVK